MKLSTAVSFFCLIGFVIAILTSNGCNATSSKDISTVIQTLSIINDRLEAAEKKLGIEVPKDKVITFVNK